MNPLVLRPNFARRLHEDGENYPPHIIHRKWSLTFKTSPKDSLSHFRRRRTRTNSITMKHPVESARRKSIRKASVKKRRHAKSAIESRDVEMQTTNIASSPLPTQNVSLPRELLRPSYLEVSRAAITAIDPSLAEVDFQFIRDRLRGLAPELLYAISSVAANPSRDVLPSELMITVGEGINDNLPTHIMAVHGPLTRNEKRPVTLYPIHAIILASHCARLPPFPPDNRFRSLRAGPRITLPVCPLRIPSPQTFRHLSLYLYTGCRDILWDLFPTRPPACLLTKPSHDNVQGFARSLASTFTSELLLRTAASVHGLWQNACALGIFDEGLWQSLGTMWSILLTSLAIGTGSLNCFQ